MTRRYQAILLCTVLVLAACGGADGANARDAPAVGDRTADTQGAGTESSPGAADAGKGDSCVGEWTSTAYRAEGRTVVEGTGTGMTLRIAPDGSGYMDLSTMTPIEVDMSDLGAGAVRIIQDGSGWFSLSDAGEGAFLGGVVVSGYSITAEVKLGEEWTEAGPGMTMTGAAVAGGSTVDCDGSRLLLTAPAAEFEFQRVSSDPGTIPPVPADAQALEDDAVDAPPPDWGADLDACTILDIAEIAAVFPDAEQPEAEDDLSTQFLRQCTYWGGLFIQAAPTESPATVGTMAEAMDADVVEVGGIGEWAFALVNRPDPDFGITDSVLMVTAANERGTIRLLTWDEVFQGTSEYEGLLSLLELALGRL